MSTFYVRPDFLQKILEIGITNTQNRIDQANLIVLEQTVERFARKSFFEWTGEISLENYETLKSEGSILPVFEHEFDLSLKEYVQMRAIKLNVLNKYLDICEASTKEIKFDDKEFYELLCIAKQKYE